MVHEGGQLLIFTCCLTSNIDSAVRTYATGLANYHALMRCGIWPRGRSHFQRIIFPFCCSSRTPERCAFLFFSAVINWRSHANIINLSLRTRLFHGLSKEKTSILSQLEKMKNALWALPLTDGFRFSQNSRCNKIIWYFFISCAVLWCSLHCF